MKPSFYLFTSVGAAFISIVSGLAYYTFTGENLISASEAKKMLKNKKIKHVIDVRTQTEYNLGHYKDAINFPIGSMDSNSIKKIKQKHKLNKDDTMLVYCNTGQRARSAAEKLKNYGFKNIYYIAGPHISIQ